MRSSSWPMLALPHRHHPAQRSTIPERQGEMRPDNQRSQGAMMDVETKRIHSIWAEMLSRCRNPNNKGYANYGGRGIGVCERWFSFKNFMADMGPRPRDTMLDRRNNDLGYSPDNCRWATRKEQNSNRRNCIYVDCDGERVTLREYCRRKGLRYRPIVKRIRIGIGRLMRLLLFRLGLGERHGSANSRQR